MDVSASALVTKVECGFYLDAKQCYGSFLHIVG